MKKFSKILAIVLAALMIMMCAAACGNDAAKDGEKDNTPDDGTKGTAKVKVIEIPLTDELYAFGVSKDDPALLESVNSFITEIKDSGKFDEIIDKYFNDGTPTPVESAAEDSTKDQLIVATNAAFAPFEYMDGDKYLGVDMEIAKLLADKLGKELVIKNVEFDSVCSTVDAGYADIAMAGLTINEERTEFVTFSDSYYTASQMVIVKGDDTTFDACTTADDVITILNTYTESTNVGVQAGTTGQYFVEGDEDWGFDGFNVTCKGYDSGALAAQDMINGNLSLVIIDQAPAFEIVKAINAVN